MTCTVPATEPPATEPPGILHVQVHTNMLDRVGQELEHRRTSVNRRSTEFCMLRRLTSGEDHFIFPRVQSDASFGRSKAPSRVDVRSTHPPPRRAFRLDFHCRARHLLENQRSSQRNIASLRNLFLSYC